MKSKGKKKGRAWKAEKEATATVPCLGCVASIIVGTIEAISKRWEEENIVGAIYVIYRGLINRLMKQ